MQIQQPSQRLIKMAVNALCISLFSGYAIAQGVGAGADSTASGATLPGSQNQQAALTGNPLTAATVSQILEQLAKRDANQANPIIIDSAQIILEFLMIVPILG